MRLAKEMTPVIRSGVTDSDLVTFRTKRAAELGATEFGVSIAVNPVGENKKRPLDRLIESGQTIVCDMGAPYQGYAADIKFLWYVTKGNEEIPEILQKQWEACADSLDVAIKGLRPGRPGYEVHEEAWAELERHGFPRDQHSYGHQIGCREHDAGPWLGDRANPYRSAEGILQEGMIVTLDPTINRVGMPDPHTFCMGMEVMADVTLSGAVLLHEPQKEIWVVRF